MKKISLSLVQRLGWSVARFFGVGLLAFVGANAPATVVTYSALNDFQAAAPGTSEFFFPAPTGSGPEPRPYIDGPLGFSTTQGATTRPYLRNDGAYGAGVNYLATINNFGGFANLAIQPQAQAGSLYALAFDLGTFHGADTITLGVNLVTIGTFTIGGGAPTTVFIGITDTDPIRQVTFTTATGTEIDTLDFRAVPEPSTYALMGVVLAGGCFLYRRRMAAV